VDENQVKNLGMSTGHGPLLCCEQTCFLWVCRSSCRYQYANYKQHAIKEKGRKNVYHIIWLG